MAIKLHGEFVAWHQNGRNSPTHRCTSPWGSSQSDCPAHRCPLFGAWRVPRVPEPRSTVRVLSQTPSVPFLSLPSGPSCFQSRAPPERRLGCRSSLAGYPPSPKDPPHHLSPELGGGFAGRSGLPSHRANGWGRLGEAAGCWTEVPTFKGMWHDAAQSVQTFKGKVWTPSGC